MDTINLAFYNWADLEAEALKQEFENEVIKSFPLLSGTAWRFRFEHFKTYSQVILTEDSFGYLDTPRIARFIVFNNKAYIQRTREIIANLALEKLVDKNGNHYIDLRGLPPIR